MKCKAKIKSGSSRDKTEKTNRQNKWLNPFFKYGIKRRIAFKKILNKLKLVATKKKLGL